MKSLKNAFGTVRLCCFGPWRLVEDDSIRSKASSLLNADVGYQFTNNVKLSLDRALFERVGFEVVDGRRLELLTSALRTRRSPN